MRNNRFAALVLAPICLSMFIFLLLPVALGLVISLYEYNPLNAANPFVGLANFRKLLSDQVFLLATRNTMFFVFVTVALNIAATLVIAQVICALPRRRARSFFRVVFFMPCVAPLVAAGMVWGSMFSTKYGVVNSAFQTLFDIPARNWMGTASYVMPILILFTLWADVGYNIVIFTAGIDGIPAGFYEAAAIDGAGPVQRFFRITLPLLGRTLSFVVIMTLISHFQMFAQFEVMTRAGSGSGGPGNSGLVLTLLIYKTAFKAKDMGYASAMAFVLFLIIMAFTALSRRLSRVDWGY